MTTDNNEKIKTGEEAQNVLESPVVVGAFNQILNAGYQAWISTEPSDTKTRESLYYQQRATLEFKQTLISTVDNGKIAKNEIREGKNE
jgi:uncharacterized protein YecT (DUF1311 family)